MPNVPMNWWGQQAYEPLDVYGPLARPDRPNTATLVPGSIHSGVSLYTSQFLPTSFHLNPTGLPLFWQSPYRVQYSTSQPYAYATPVSPYASAMMQESAATSQKQSQSSNIAGWIRGLLGMA